MMIDSRRLNTLKKLIQQGYTENKDIVSLTAEDMTKFCRSFAEITAIVDLQKAIKSNNLVAFLAGKEFQ